MQTYNVPVTNVEDFDTLDPALAHDQSSISAIQMIYTGLVQLDDNLQIKPQLAQSWELASDGVTWTFHLKPHLKFNDGTPLTSTDVAYSIDRALQPETKSKVAPIYLGLIKDSDRLLAGQISTLIGDSLQKQTLIPSSSLQTKKLLIFSPCSLHLVHTSLNRA
jgi:peptide/nickel transport system substrate-binding protein/oligopeptide transport system substrate-binding protein